jgi:hypothetical protein
MSFHLTPNEDPYWRTGKGSSDGRLKMAPFADWNKH